MVNHADLSRQLALALGYAPESVRVESSVISDENEYVTVYTDRYNYGHGGFWYDFDYRDPSVCLPLIKWLIHNHYATIEEKRAANKEAGVFIAGDGWYWADTLEEAVARACIAVGVR